MRDPRHPRFFVFVAVACLKDYSCQNSAAGKLAVVRFPAPHSVGLFL
jgi:hypothetical protein